MGYTQIDNLSIAFTQKVITKTVINVGGKQTIVRLKLAVKKKHYNSGTLNITVKSMLRHLFIGRIRRNSI